MTDKIDNVIAHILANRADAVIDSQRQDADRAHDADLQKEANAAVIRAWAALRTRIAIFLLGLNVKLQVAQIEISFAIGVDNRADLISEYEAWFSRGSQAVDHNMRTVFKAHANGQIDIFIAAVGDRAPRATFEFRTETMRDDDITDVFARFLEFGTSPQADLS